MNVLRLLLDLSPLAIATFHGYAAAWLAVKMLFRPRTAVYILNWKVPFTPGLLPSERERFVETLSGVVAEKLLTEDVIAAELTELRLEEDVETLARHRYTVRSQPDALLQVITTQLLAALETMKGSADAKLQLAREARRILRRQLEREYSPAVRFVVNLALNEDLVFRIVDRAIDDIAERLSESLVIREALRQTVAQLPDAVFTGETSLQVRVVQTLIQRLSRQLDFKDIIKRRFDSFSNELIEQIIYETAGREIRGITGFGALVGLVIGVMQTGINLGHSLLR